MGLFDSLLGTEDARPETEQRDFGRHEIYRDDEYSAAYAIAARREELDALDELLNQDETAATPLEQSPFLQDVVDDLASKDEAWASMQDAGDDLTNQITTLLEPWQTQLTGEIGVVWWPVPANTRFRLYLHYLDARADLDEDGFRFPDTVDQVKTLIQRGFNAADADDTPQLAIVKNDHVPWKTDPSDP